MTIHAAADGSALGNPGPAGWGWYVDESCWASGGWPHGTNNMGELMAVLDLLRQTAHVEEDLHVYCDSTYVINTITKWMAGWKRRGWKKGDGKPVMNLELVRALDEAMVGRKVHFEWVKGHAGHELNEEADRLANAAALAWREGREPDAGPGFPGSTRASAPVEEGRGPVTGPEPEPDLFSDLEEPEPGPSDVELVVSLERSLLTDEVRSDRAAVAALLHPQWQEVGRSGRLWTREEMLDRIGPLDPGPLDPDHTDPSGPTDPSSLEVVDVAEVSSGTILLVWRSVVGGTSTLRSSLWVRTSGGWQQRFHQGTEEN